MTFFYRKAPVNHSTVLDRAHSDLSSNVTSPDITSGAGNNAFLMDFSLNDTPPFGEAKPVGLSLYMYSNDVTAKWSTVAPKLKFYKMNIDVGSNTSSVTAQNLDTYIISSQPANKAFLTENFDGYDTPHIGKGSISYTFFQRSDNFFYIPYSPSLFQNDFQGLGSKLGTGFETHHKYYCYQAPSGDWYVPVGFYDDIAGETLYEWAVEKTSFPLTGEDSVAELVTPTGGWAPSVLFWSASYLSMHHELLSYSQAAGIPEWSVENAMDYSPATITEKRVNTHNSIFRCVTTQWQDWQSSPWYSDLANNDVTGSGGTAGIGKYMISSGCNFTSEYFVDMETSYGDGMVLDNKWYNWSTDDYASRANGGGDYKIHKYAPFTTEKEHNIQCSIAQCDIYPPTKMDAARGINDTNDPDATDRYQVVWWKWGSATLVDGDFFILYDGENRPHVFWIEVGGSGGSAPTTAVTGLQDNEVHKCAVASATATTADVNVIRGVIHALSEFSCTATSGADAAASFNITNATYGWAESPQDGGLLGVGSGKDLGVMMRVLHRGRGNADGFESNVGSSISLDVNFHNLGPECKQRVNSGASFYGSNNWLTTYKRSFIIWFGNKRLTGRNAEGVQSNLATTEDPNILRILKDDTGGYQYASAGAAQSSFGWIFHREWNAHNNGSLVTVTPIILSHKDNAVADMYGVPGPTCGIGDDDGPTGGDAGAYGLFITDKEVAGYESITFDISGQDIKHNIEIFLDSEESGGHLIVRSIDSDTLLATSKAPNHKKVPNGYSDFPNYMSLACTNIGRLRNHGSDTTQGAYYSDRSEGTQTGSGTPTGTSGSPQTEKYTTFHRSSIGIDKVQFNGFSYDMQSATQNGDNSITESIWIKGQGGGLPCQGIKPRADTENISGTVVNRLNNAPSYLSFGYSSRAAISGAVKYGLFSGYLQSSTQDSRAIDDSNIHVGFIDQFSKLGRYFDNTFFEDSSHTYGLGGSEAVLDGNRYCGNFSSKGFIQYNFTDTSIGPGSR